MADSSARALPVLMYHHVSPSPGLVTVSPYIFHEQMQSLTNHGWRTAGLGDVERFFAGDPLPAKTCIISFDDGYLDNRVYAAPVLRKFGMTAVVFLVTGWLGEGPSRSGLLDAPNHRECKRRIASGDADSVMIRWSEAEEMSSAGIFEFHSHTHTHQRWDKLLADPAERKVALASDLANSRSELADRLGISSRHLCWPQGYYDADYLEVAKEGGFDHLYTTDPHINLPGTATDQIGRFVTKERGGAWLLQRTRLYANPFIGRIYAAIRR